MRLFSTCIIAGLLGALAGCGGIGPLCCYAALPDELWADGRSEIVSAWVPRYSLEFYRTNSRLMPLSPAPIKERVQARLEAYLALHPAQDAAGYFAELGMACSRDGKQRCEAELPVSYWCVHREIRAADLDTRENGLYRIELDLSAGRVQNVRGRVLAAGGHPACP